MPYIVMAYIVMAYTGYWSSSAFCSLCNSSMQQHDRYTTERCWLLAPSRIVCTLRSLHCICACLVLPCIIAVKYDGFGAGLLPCDRGLPHGYIRLERQKFTCAPKHTDASSLSEYTQIRKHGRTTS